MRNNFTELSVYFISISFISINSVPYTMPKQRANERRKAKKRKGFAKTGDTNEGNGLPKTIIIIILMLLQRMVYLKGIQGKQVTRLVCKQYMSRDGILEIFERPFLKCTKCKSITNFQTSQRFLLID